MSELEQQSIRNLSRLLIGLIQHLGARADTHGTIQAFAEEYKDELAWLFGEESEGSGE